MLRSLFYSFLNALVPPRRHEVRVLALTVEELIQLKHTDGLPYHDPRVTALVWEVKYKANPAALRLAGALLSEELLAIASEELGKILLVPVPMHAERKKVRGYNQTELLCEATLAELSGRTSLEKGPRVSSLRSARPFFHESSPFDYFPSALTRIRNSAPQQTLARSTRLHNVKGSMQATDAAKIKGRVCVVIDDVATTGATLLEAERALKRAGAQKVYTIALARS